MTGDYRFRGSVFCLLVREYLQEVGQMIVPDVTSVPLA